MVMMIRPGQRLIIPGAQVYQPLAVSDGSFTGVLDGISNVVVAYSLRKLRSAYSGYAVRIRRSSDSTEQDIGFDGSGNFDNSAFSSFVGGGTGYVRTWYDQSGNSKDIGQSTTSSQPTIALSAINSLPSIAFSPPSFLSGALAADMLNFSVFIACRETTKVDNAGFVSMHNGTGSDFTNDNAFVLESAATANNRIIQALRNTAPIYVTGSTMTPAGIYSIIGGATVKLRKNGTNTASSFNSSAGTSSFLLCGARFLSGSVSASHRLIGNEAEILIAASNIGTTDHNTIGNDMASYYGLSWTTVT